MSGPRPPEGDGAPGPRSGARPAASRLALALVALVALGLVAALGTRAFVQASRRERAKEVVLLLANALRDFVARNGPPTEPITDIRTASRIALELRALRLERAQVRDGVIIDPWGRPLDVHLGADGILVRSAGPDGDLATRGDNLAYQVPGF